MAVKKQWYEIVAPKMFEEKTIGETTTIDSKRLVGRTIQVSIMDLSAEYAKFYLKMELQISSVVGSKAYTKLIGHDVLRERIHRMVQRHSRRVDVVQDVKLDDGTSARLKTIFILPMRVNTSIKNKCRAKAKETINSFVVGKNFEDIMKSIISSDLQNSVKKAVNQIYPVSTIEVRKSKLYAK